jgi:hypothetical protein
MVVALIEQVFIVVSCCSVPALQITEPPGRLSINR